MARSKDIGKRFVTSMTFTEEDVEELKELHKHWTYISIFRRGMELCRQELVDYNAKQIEEHDADQLQETQRKVMEAKQNKRPLQERPVREVVDEDESSVSDSP